MVGFPGDIICGNAALLVGRSGQRDHGPALVDKVFNLDHVTHSVNIGIRCLHHVVDNYAATGIHLQAAAGRELAIGAHSYCQNNKIGSQLCPAL